MTPAPYWQSDDGTVTLYHGDCHIKGLPAGTYTVEAWHEKYGTQQLKVTVSDKGVAADFKYAGK